MWRLAVAVGSLHPLYGEGSDVHCIFLLFLSRLARLVVGGGGAGHGVLLWRCPRCCGVAEASPEVLLGERSKVPFFL